MRASFRFLILAASLAAGCLPPSAVPGVCGDGVLDVGEICDPGIEAGPGACPTTCDGGDACNLVVLVGSAANCSASCATAPLTVCRDGDGCCPDGCGAHEDSDCAQSTCGNGRLDPGETCDGDCPTCDDANACTTDTRSGDPSECNVTCVNEPITACVDDDGCCPDGCTAANDSDCGGGAECGNGIREDDETCDGDCPTSCESVDACEQLVLVGSASTCDVTCEARPITWCASGDGCCPDGCTNANDADCVPVTCTPECEDGFTCRVGGCIPQAPIGAACVVDDDCLGRCRTEKVDGYPGGYCTETCSSSKPCPAGAICHDALCLEACVTNADCGRDGYRCEATPNGNACVPYGASTTKAVGDACTSIADCPGGIRARCLTAEGSDAYEGYCSQICDASNPCPGGSQCVDGLCFRNCFTNAECRGSGYECQGPDGKYCGVAGTGTRGLGEACAGVWECAGGAQASCLKHYFGMSFPGGYCSRSCSADGHCGSGGICEDPRGFPFPDKTCLLGCSISQGCTRDGYTCRDPQIFPRLPRHACLP